MQVLDRRTMDEAGVPGTVLMDRAGYGVAQAVCSLQQNTGCERSVHLFAGKGNNGGDVFVAARYLKASGFVTQVTLAGKVNQLYGDALDQYNLMIEQGGTCQEYAEEGNWNTINPLDDHNALVVDGLLGTGTKGAPRGIVAAAIRAINRLSSQAWVVAIDIPSGLDGQTGETPGVAVLADVTVTMAVPKQGFIQPAAHPLLGHLQVVDIGIPATFLEEEQKNAPALMEIISASNIMPHFGRRVSNTHKGTYGHTLLVGGAPGYSGAITMAGASALRSGAGLVSVRTHQKVLDRVALALPEAMVKPLDQQESLQAYSSILLGPGMMTSTKTRETIERILTTATCPVVLDADALNVFAGELDQLKTTQTPLVLTPHPGEMARLLGISTKEVQTNRTVAAQEAAKRSNAIVVLKGSGTLIAEPNGRVHLNLTGNAGMATGGSGDVLAGFLAGLLAQSKPLVPTVCASVFLHGTAGDFAAWNNTQQALCATDLITWLPQAWKSIQPR